MKNTSKTLNARWRRCLCLCLAAACPALASDWPQYQFDAQHQGRTPDSPAPPYEIAWIADFFPENLASQQPMVSGGLVYVATKQGRAYALDSGMGERKWCAELGGGTLSMAAVEGDRVFFSTIAGAMVALDKQSGELLWTCDTGFGISASPCLAENAIFIGNRSGELLRIEQDTGRIAWRRPLGWRISSTAACHEGRVFVLTEDMRMHCVDAASGAEVWTSAQVNGMMFRDRAPAIVKGRVVFHTLPAEILDDELVGYPFGGWSYEPEDKHVPEDQVAALAAGTDHPAGFFEAQEAAIRFLEENPQHQTMFVLDERTGEQVCVPPIQRMLAGWTVALPPPAVDSRGLLAVPVGFGLAKFGFYDVEKNRIVDVIVPMKGTNTDEHHASSAGGNRVFILHYAVGQDCPSDVVFDVNTREAVVPQTTPWHKGSMQASLKNRYHAVSLLNGREPEAPTWDVISYPVHFGAAAISGDMFFKTEPMKPEKTYLSTGRPVERAMLVVAWKGMGSTEGGAK